MAMKTTFTVYITQRPTLMPLLTELPGRSTVLICVHLCSSVVLFRMKRRTKTVLWACAVIIVLGALAVTFWMRRFPNYTPVEVVRDLQAASQVGPAPQPVERFMELRYGPLTDPANRQKAFLDFFNIGHIKGLRLLVSRTPLEHRQANINAMAQWVADYRSTMTPEEKAALGAYVRSSGGSAKLHQATAQYLKQDVQFRASTAPVIQELMTTLATVQKP